jgi:hypothetical protein
MYITAWSLHMQNTATYWHITRHDKRKRKTGAPNACINRYAPACKRRVDVNPHAQLISEMLCNLCKIASSHDVTALE